MERSEYLEENNKVTCTSARHSLGIGSKQNRPYSLNSNHFYLLTVSGTITSLSTKPDLNR